MEIRNLVTFLQVAERKSFSKAAEALSYTQSTVSAQIKQLEDELNTRLFDRVNHGVVLTQSGNNLVNKAQKILNIVNEIESESSDTDICEGNVRFAMAPSICDLMMGQTYMTFNKMFPKINVKIMAAETYEMLEMLNRNEADIIFTVDRHVYDAQYIIASEKKVKMNFIAPSDFPLAGKKNISIEELIKYPFVLTEKNLSYRKPFDEKLAEKNLEVTPVIEMGSTSLILELVELGLGVSFLPDYVTQRFKDEGKICYLDVKDFEVGMWRQLLYHKDKWISPAIQRVIEYCSRISERI